MTTEVETKQVTDSHKRLCEWAGLDPAKVDMLDIHTEPELEAPKVMIRQLAKGEEPPLYVEHKLVPIDYLKTLERIAAEAKQERK